MARASSRSPAHQEDARAVADSFLQRPTVFPTHFHETSKRDLGLSESRRLADGREVKPCQLPLSLLTDKHQRRAHLRVHGIAPKGRFLSQTTNHNGGVVVHTHRCFIQRVSGILHVTGLMSREPFLLGQQEAQRPHANEIISQRALQKCRVSVEFCSSPLFRQLLQVLFCLCR